MNNTAQQDVSLLNKKNLFLLIALVLVGNWFFTFQLFSLKDDNSYYYMPMRMYLSDALHSGKLIFWNPYFQLGLPQYSDMQGAVWNPVALILCGLFKYNHTCFLAEYLLYLIIAAIGIFKLASIFIKNNHLIWLVVIVHILGGYTSAVSNFFNWNASLAFLPWLYLYFIKIYRQPNYKNAIILGLILWLNIVCGYPGYLLFTLYFLVAWFMVILFRELSVQHYFSVIRITLFYLLALSIAILICLPAIISYTEFFPFYFRGNHLATELPFQDCVFPAYFRSLLVPSAVYSNDMIDPSHSANRNLYFGLLPLFLSGILIVKLKQLQNRNKYLFAITAVVTFVFLFGHLTPLGIFIYKYIPLLGASKWSASYRIFIIVILLIGSAILLEQQKLTLSKKQLFLWRIITIIALMVMLYKTNYWFYRHHWVTEKHQWLMVANAVWQAVLWIALAIFLPRILQHTKWILLFTLLDLFVNHTIGMAVTGVSTIQPKVYNEYAHTFYYTNQNEHLMKTPTERREIFHFNPWKNHNASKVFYPEFFIQSNTMFTGYENLFINNKLGFDFLKNHRFVFSEDIQQLEVTQASLDYNNISFTVNAGNTGSIIIQQNFYERWRESSGKKITAFKDCMMQIQVPKGVTHVHLQYDSGNIFTCFLISLAVLSCCLLILLFKPIQGLIIRK